MEKKSTDLFGRSNYTLMGLGLVIIAIGFFMMAGGKNENPTIFDENQVYNFRRITLAPILIIAGFVVEIYAIMKKSDDE